MNPIYEDYEFTPDDTIEDHEDYYLEITNDADGRVLLKFENRDYDQITLEHPGDVKVVGRALTVLNVHNL